MIESAISARRFGSIFLAGVFVLIFIQWWVQFTEHRIVFYGKNEYGPIWVYDFQKQRILSFKKPFSGARQTAFSLEKPERIVFNYQKDMIFSLMLGKEPESFLMIGLGGGTLSKTIRDLYPNAKIDIIEINPLVLKVARDYFYFQEDSNMKVYLGDGFDLLKELASKSYDAVYLDAFGPNYIPEEFLSDEFFLNLKKVVNPTGIVCMNTFEKTEFSTREAVLCNRHFSSCYSISKGNKVIYLFNQKLSKREIKNKVFRYHVKFSKYSVDLLLSLNRFLKENVGGFVEDV